MSLVLVEKTARDLTLTHTVMDYAAPGARSAMSDDDVVRLHIGLRGRYRAHYPSLGRRFERLGPHFSLFYARPFELDVVNETLQLETFGMKIPVARFLEYAGDLDADVARFCERVARGRAGFLLEPSPALPAALEHAVRRMLEPRYDGALAELYLLSQGLELLVRALEFAGARAASSGGAAALPLTKRDRDKLIAAREFVDARLQDPPSLAGVARRIGLNEYKLKRGFKQLFGATLFGYLTAQRLELARRMLLDTDKTAAEVGFELGYATPQHFSQAFKKRFGIAPGALRNARALAELHEENS